MGTNASNFYSIINGPSADRLFDACKMAYSKDDRVSVSFDIAIGYTMPPDHPGSAYVLMETKDTKISSIGHEDGTGCSFNLEGYLTARINPASDWHAYQFTAYFNTKSRKGTITIF